MESLNTCPRNLKLTNTHPLCLHAKLQSFDKDSPTYKDIQHLPPEEFEKWLDAMDSELHALHERQFFSIVNHSDAINRQIVNCTWVLKCK
jgi:hypothetical protein